MCYLNVTLDIKSIYIYIYRKREKCPYKMWPILRIYTWLACSNESIARRGYFSRVCDDKCVWSLDHGGSLTHQQLAGAQSVSQPHTAPYRLLLLLYCNITMLQDADELRGKFEAISQLCYTVATDSGIYHEMLIKMSQLVVYRAVIT